MEEKLANKKSRKSKEDIISTHKEGDRTSPVVTGTVTSKKSKRRKVEEEDGEVVPDEAEAVKVKKKRRHDDEGHAEPGERKKKRRREQEASLNELIGDEEESKKKTKNPKSDGTTEGKGREELRSSRKKGRKKEKIQDDDSEPIKKKKRKAGCTDLPDPEDDASLANQARKALTYAHQQFDDPTNWKFNKARQNWLIRNIWSTQAIPDLYMPLLTRYLANVKGGVRETLVTTCRTILSPTSTVPADPTTQLPITTTETETDKLKQLRARTILDALTTEL